MFQCAFLFSAFLDFSTREKISGRSLLFISTHTYCSDAGRLLLKFGQILSHGFDLETVALLCRVASSGHARGLNLSLVRLTEGNEYGRRSGVSPHLLHLAGTQEKGCTGDVFS